MADTAPDANTFELDEPRRPGSQDFNGAAKVDDQEFTPDAVTMPTAGEYNTMCKLLIGMGAVLPYLIISVANDGASASLLSFVSANGNLENTDFTISRVSSGLVKIVVATAKLVALTRQPMACPNGSTAAKIAARYAINGSNTEFYVKCDIDCDVTISIG